MPNTAIKVSHLIKVYKLYDNPVDRLGESLHPLKKEVSLTDMVKNIENGLVLIENWLRNKNTVEFLGLWEQINNPDFKGVEFDEFKNAAGLNSFTMSPSKWVESTNAIGIISKTGQYLR